MQAETFITGLLLASALTGLATEAVKKMLDMTRRLNLLAGIVSLIVSTGMAAGYATYTGTGITAQMIVAALTFVFATWLTAMVGYDKVIQTITQLGS